MAIDLNSVANSGSSSNLQDYITPVDKAEMPINNQKTADNLASHAALLTEPETAVDSYKSIIDEMSGNDGSITMERIFQDATIRENNLSIESMKNILGDDNIPLDQKVAMASAWRTGAVNPIQEKSPQELVGINQLEKDGNITDNAEVDDTRWALAGKLKQVNDYNSEIQKMINEAQTAYNPSTFGAVKDFLEMMLPFAETPYQLGVQKALREKLGEGDNLNGQATALVKSLALLGESKEEIRARIAKVPLEQRMELAKAVYDMVIQSNSSMTGGKNSLALMNDLRAYLVDGEYTTGDRIIDNISSILDVVGVGATLRSLKASGEAASAARAANIVERSPISAGETVARTNTKSANELLKLAADDTTGEVAKRLYGVSREDAIVSNVGPEIALPEGKVRFKPLIDNDQFDPDMNVVDQVLSTHGSIQFSEAERASKLRSVSNDFNSLDVTGLVPHKEMIDIRAVDEGVNVRTILGPAEGGFSDPQEALNQVKYATRKYGVKDEELQVLKLDGDGNYTPVKDVELEYAKDQAAKRTGNYVVSINHTTKYDPMDTVEWSTTSVEGSFLGVPLNIFDKLPVYTKGKGGSITQHLIPPQSYIDPLLTRAASVTSDQAAHTKNLLFNLANEYASKYKSLDKTQQKIFDNYILEANHKSLKFEPSKLRADGWTEDMIGAYRAWKRNTDTLYVLENADLVRQSSRKGYKMLVTGDGQDKFLIKPIANTTAGKIPGFRGKAYDPELGMIRDISAVERKELYKEGGTLAIARTPVNVDGKTIPYVIVKNKPSSYARSLRESDTLLNYRDGYFTVYYKNPVFITQVVKNADGTEYTKAIATSENIKDAEAHLARLRKTNPKGDYAMRSDIKGEEFDEMMWNARVNSGRTAQRTRGKMLQDVTDRPTDLNFRHIAPPEESLTRAINSISQRINYKEFIDTAKERFKKQYWDMLPEHPQTHAKMWPDSVKDLKKPGLEGDSRAYSDAISTYRYIDQMENGFVNLLDDASKNFFKGIADTSGKKGFQWIESAARKGQEGSPTAYARKKAFRFLLAANPLRQVVVQASQALPVILSNNASFAATRLIPQMLLTRYLDRGGDVETFFKLGDKAITGLSMDEARDLAKAYKASGISSAVSAHSLIRDDLKSLVNRGALDKIGHVAGKPIDVMQKVGFEAGENMLMRSIWLSEYDLLKKSGAKIDASALSNLHARVRDLTGNMNRAGELAYNENALSMVMQFAQAQHKILAQVLVGNRALSGADRAKLATSYLLTYGTGYGVVYEMASKLLPEDDTELHNAVSGGLFNVIVNKALSEVYGEEVNTDFSSSMRLFEIPSLGKMFETMATMDLQTIVSQSPSAALVVGDNAKLSNLVKSIYRFYTVPEDDGNFKDVGVNFLSMFSGASNTFKASYAFKKGQSINTRGEIVDSDVNQMEAMMKMLGFSTVNEMLSYQVNSDIYFNSSKFRNDVKYMLDETTRRLAREGISEQESEYVLRMWREANRVFENNPAAMRQVQSEIRRRIKNGDYTLLKSLTSQFEFIDENQFNSALAKSPLDEEKKRELIKIYNFMKTEEE